MLHTKPIFSKIDFQRAFHQVAVDQSYIFETVYCTPFGLFEFAYMTFSLRNAARTLQRLIYKIVRDLDFVFPYLDDLCIASTSSSEHREHLIVVFEKLSKRNFTTNSAKCEIDKSIIISWS